MNLPSRALQNIAENSQGADRRPRGGGPHHPEPPPLHQPRSLAGIPDRRVAPGRHSGKTHSSCPHCEFFFKFISNPLRLTSACSPRASRGRTTSPSAPASTGGGSKTRCASTRTAAGTATWAAVPAGNTWTRTGGTGVTTGGRTPTMRRTGGGKRRSGRRAGRRPCDGTGTISTSGERATTTVAAATKTTCTFGTTVTRNGYLLAVALCVVRRYLFIELF